MEILQSIAPDMIAAAICVYMLDLLRRNTVVNSAKTWIFGSVVILDLMAVLAEVCTVALNYYGSANSNILDMVCYTIVYAAGPTMAILLIFLTDDSRSRFKKYNIAFICIFGVFILSNFFHHKMFSVTGNTYYSRGPLYYVYLGMTALSLILLLIKNVIHLSHELDRHRRSYFLSILLLEGLFIAVEIFNPDVLMIWPGTAVCLLLYYVHLRELQFLYDPLTGAFNRSAFNNAIDDYADTSRPVALIMLDLNDLKKTNDNEGHEAGDKYLRESAVVMINTFDDIGRVYRIGGDEFCVICPDAHERAVAKDIEIFTAKCALKAAQIQKTFCVACGCAIRTDKKESLRATLERADALMYEDKAAKKKAAK